MRILGAIVHFAKIVWQKFRLSRYDDFTIAEYFRQQGAHISDHCRILLRDLGTEPYLIRIGNHCTIAGGVKFITHDGAAWVFTEELPSVQKFGTIEILDNCFIGQNAILLPNISVGPNSIVGAGAVVTRNVPPNTVVAGCPAKPICTLEEYKRKTLSAWQYQKPPGYMANLRNDVRYTPADIQKEKVRHASLLRKHLQKVLWNSRSGLRTEKRSPEPHLSSDQLSPYPAKRDRRRPILVHDKEAGKKQSSE